MVAILLGTTFLNLPGGPIFVTTPSGPTVPNAFIAANWTLTDAGTSGDLTVTINTLPSDGGSAITDLQRRVDLGTWVSLGGTTTGSYTISGLTDDQLYSVEIRAVNSIGAGLGSDIKFGTPTSGSGFTLVNNATEFQNAMAAASPGDDIRLSSSVSNMVATVSNQAYASTVTVSQQAGATVQKIDFNNCDNVTLNGLQFSWDNQGGLDFGASGFAADQAYALVMNNGTGLVVQNCVFNMDPTQSGGKQTLTTLKKRPGGIRSTNATIEVDTCHFLRVRDGMVIKSGDANIHDCTGFQIFEDFITGDATDWTVDDNSATMFEGTYIRTYTVDSTASMVVGEVYTKGVQVIEIETIVNGTTIHGRINNYDLPTAGLFTGPSSKTFTVTTAGGEVAGKNIHGDFFQPLLLSGSTTYRLYFRRNWGYRTLAQITNDVCQEPLTQFLLAQRNGGTGGWDPTILNYNVSNLGQPFGMKVQFAMNGTLSFNTIMWAERGIRSDIEINGFTNMTVEGNAGDNNSGGAIDDNGGHTNTTFTNNVFVDGNSGAQTTNYVNPFVYPQLLVNMAPVSGQAVANAGAGALKTDGTFRP